MKKFDKLFKNKKVIITVIALALVLLAVASSYAFFTSITNNDKKQEAKLATGTMALTFKDGNNGVNAQLMLGESVTKKFIIENTGSLEASLSLDWDQLINTYMDGSLTYRLVRTENDVEVEEIIPKTNMPVSSEKLTQTLASELSVPSKETYYYDLIITFNNLDVDQESDKDAVYNTHFNVGLPLKYRYYTLIVNPNGGTWKEFTTSQSYLLKNNETLSNITNPTRVGYTFDGWEIKGTSSTFDSGTFTMGISDASLTAKWTTNKYTVTIDPDGGEYDGDKELNADYGSTITLSTPTRVGYTFSHWETTGGTLSGNTLTVTDPSNVTVRAIWTPNKYSYIVRHNKQNVDGNGYTTFETENIENVDYGTEVTPELKEYEGFTQPREKKTITIKEDNSLNVVEYNYTRNKYTLTVNPDGGTGGTVTQEVYYEETVDLVAPTKVGYDFQNWTIESGTGTITNNTFKMGVGDTTIKANWKAQEYSLTFNANGGTVSPESKKITYSKAYGELPTPTKDGYVFEGWYTTSEKTGGDQITPTTTVSAISNQTLYARWNGNVLLAVGNDSYADKIWEHKSKITKVIFENTINPTLTHAYSYDVSTLGNSSIMAYLVTDTEDSTKYVAHIQSNGKMYANPDSSWLFANFTKLKSIEGLEYLDTSNVINMSYMFAGCTSITTLNVSNLNTDNATNMEGMFGFCSNITSLNLNNFDTSNVTNMMYMFGYCSKLISLSLNNFDTSIVTQMSLMFANCCSLTTLNVSNFNTSNVTSMASMFESCSGLTSLNVSNFDTRNVSLMGGMFSGCSGLTNLDVSNFDTTNVTEMSHMFSSCKSLKSLDVSNFDTSNVSKMGSMFFISTSITTLDLSNFDTTNVTDMTRMFQGCSSLSNLNINNFDTSNVTNIDYMFEGCSSLLNLNISNFNTSKVTSMSEMFAGCSNLTSLDMAHFNTNNVTNMYGMFQDCSSLISLNLQNWDISSVTYKIAMFNNVPSSIKITVSNITMRTWVIDASNSPKLTTANFTVRA